MSLQSDFESIKLPGTGATISTFTDPFTFRSMSSRLVADGDYDESRYITRHMSSEVRWRGVCEGTLTRPEAYLHTPTVTPRYPTRVYLHTQITSCPSYHTPRPRAVLVPSTITR